MCDVDDCDRGVYARGLCGRHYKQRLRHGEIKPDSTPAPCAVEKCGRRAVTRGWCHGHYLRWSRTGDLKADVPLTRRERGSCTVDDCARPAHAQELCRAHLERLRQHGDPRAHVPLRVVTGAGSLSHGYWKVPVPRHLRYLVNGETRVTSPRVV